MLVTFAESLTVTEAVDEGLLSLPKVRLRTLLLRSCFQKSVLPKATEDSGDMVG